MTPTEHELTVATEALARHVHAARRGGTPWDKAHPIDRVRALEEVLPLVSVVLEALPDRRASTLAEQQAQQFRRQPSTADLDQADRHGRPAPGHRDYFHTPSEGYDLELLRRMSAGRTYWPCADPTTMTLVHTQGRCSVPQATGPAYDSRQA